MAITNYNEKRPQSQIIQNKEVVLDAPVSQRNAFLFGKAYHKAEGDTKTWVEGPEAIKAKKENPLKHIYSREDIEKYFGPIEEENELAYACSLCLSESDGKPFYAMAIGGKGTETGDDELALYQAVLNTIKTTSSVQYLCPLTENLKVHEACATHCAECSNELVQRWRRVYCTLPTIDAATSEIVGNLTAAANALFSDRAVCIWVDSPKYVTSDDNNKIVEKDLKPIYVTAGIVGIRSAALPQQGLSMQELGFVSSAPLMYTKYTIDDLNTIASNGILIVTQDGDEEEVYIRHQLTTETEKGVMYYEDSVGVNIDDISYQIKDIIRGYIGKRNITPATLVEIKNRYYGLLAGLTVAPLGQIIGPQINKIVEGSVKVSIDPYMKDRVILQATVEIPLPLNSLIVYLNSVVTNSI